MASSQNEMRVVLIGRTGNGKSSTGNSLLHSRSAFHATQSGESITKDCQRESYQYTDAQGQRKTLTVVDTPGFFDTNTHVTNEMVKQKIASQIFQMTSPGVHAFLIVVQVGRFIQEEQNTINFIRQMFGPEAARYCIVVVTNEDRLDDGQSLDEYINTAPELRKLIQECGNRKLAINNKLLDAALAKRTSRLLELIVNMIGSNGGSYYTNAEYQRIEKQRQEEKRKREEEERRKKKAEEDALIARGKEEERKRSEQQLQKVRAEEQKKREEEERKAKKRQKELQEELESTQRRSRGGGDEGNILGLLRSLQGMGLGSGAPAMCSGAMPPSMAMPYSPMPSDMGMPFHPMSSGMGMGMPSPSMRPMSSGIGSAHGGRFTGEYMSTRGAANGRPIYEGPGGGQYHITPSGNRSYIRK